MNVEMNTLKKRFNLHPKGVQCLKYNENGTYFLSIGNFKENKIGVWNSKKMELAQQTYQVDAMHDAKWKPFLNEQRSKNARAVYEFAVVGKNKVSVYNFHVDDCHLNVKNEKWLAHVNFPTRLTKIRVSTILN